LTLQIGSMEPFIQTIHQAVKLRRQKAGGQTPVLIQHSQHTETADKSIAPYRRSAQHRRFNAHRLAVTYQHIRKGQHIQHSFRSSGKKIGFKRRLHGRFSTDKDPSVGGQFFDNLTGLRRAQPFLSDIVMGLQGHQPDHKIPLPLPKPKVGNNRRLRTETIGVEVGQFVKSRIGEMLAPMVFAGEPLRRNDVVGPRIAQPGHQRNDRRIIFFKDARLGPAHPRRRPDGNRRSGHDVDFLPKPLLRCQPGGSQRFHSQRRQPRRAASGD